MHKSPPGWHRAQVYVDGEFIGGSDIVMGLHQSNELEALLKGKGSGSAQ